MNTTSHRSRRRSRRSRRRQRRFVVAAFATLVPALLAFVFATASADPAAIKRHVAEVLDFEDTETAEDKLAAAVAAKRNRRSPSKDLFALDAPDPGLQVPGLSGLGESAETPGDYLQSPPDWVSAGSGNLIASAGRFQPWHGGAFGGRGGYSRGSFASGLSGAFVSGPSFFGGGVFGQSSDEPSQRGLATSSVFDSQDDGDLPEQKSDDLFGDPNDPNFSGLPDDFDPCPIGGLVVSPCYWPDPCPPGGLVVSPCVSLTSFDEPGPRTFRTPGNGGTPFANGGNGGTPSNGGGNGGRNGGRNGGSNGGGNGGGNGGSPGNGGTPSNGGGNGGTPPDDPHPVPVPAPIVLIGLGLAAMFRRRGI